MLCLGLFLGSQSFSAPGKAPRGIVRLKVFSLPRAEDMSVGAQASRAILAAFNKRYPYIKVSSWSGIKIQGAAMDAGPLMAIAGGVSPDVIYVNFRQSDSYIRQGFLYPLDKFIAREPKEEVNERILKPVRPVVYREGPNGKKHWWALPYQNVVIALYYRKDLFQEAGLNPDQPPRTWGELMADARKITNPAKGIYGIGLIGGPEASYNFYSFLLSAGAEAMARNKEGKWRAVFNSPQAVEAVYYYSRLVQGRFEKDGRSISGVAYRDVDIWQKWKEGKIGMVFRYLSDELISGVNPELIGIAPVPKGPTGLRGSEINALMMGMFAGIKDPKVRDAAWKFMWFWDSPAAIKIQTKIFVENGYGNFLNPEYLKRYGYTEYLKRVPKGWAATFKEALHNGQPEPYGKNTQMIYRYMTKPIELSLLANLGNKPPGIAKKRIKRLLDKAVKATNEMMIGIVPPKIMAFRRKVALAVAAALLLTLCLVFRYLMRIFTPEGATSSWGFRKYWKAYLILSTALLGTLLWQYIPLVSGALIAFKDYKIMGGSRWVGIDNFANVLFDKVFWTTLWHSFYYAGLTLSLGFLSPIILALLLHEVPRGKIFFRTVFYLPAVVSGLVVLFLWKSFYDPSAAGLLNKLLNIFSFGHISPQGWLKDPKWAMLAIVLPTVWAGMGAGSLLYLAALKTIPDDLYEAAEIDGANTWDKLWNVTIPTIRPLIIISFVGAFVAAFKTSGYILAMTGGGPAGSTMVLSLEIFYNAFLYLKFGTATAMAWLLGFILIGFTVYQMKRLSRMEFRATGAGK